MKSNLVGRYQTDKDNLIKVSENLHLVIGTRKKTTPQKPPKYLLQRHNPKQHTFISSLYEWQEMAGNSLTAYSFDYNGTDYVLMLDPAAGSANISLLTATKNSIVSINNMELGAKSDPNADI